jgi:predicted short-subunit dehydrogenase-like oxidoreductase (DUF2520 family)
VKTATYNPGMKIVLVGPGRAGMSLAIAAAAAEHDVVAVVGRSFDSAERGAGIVGATPLTVGDPIPESDLMLVATRDAAIEPVAARLARHRVPIDAAVHLSGLTPVSALAPLAEQGIEIGSFHPLQTLPTPETGAAKLAGSFIAITAGPGLQDTLEVFADSLGATPFSLDDDAKPLYHAAAAAAANFPLAAFAMAADLFRAAGVSWDVARPLVEAVVVNAFELGPRAALTGPVARGDTDTVAAQLAAVASASPEWQVAFARLVELLASLTGRSDEFEAVLNKENQ